MVNKFFQHIVFAFLVLCSLGVQAQELNIFIGNNDNISSQTSHPQQKNELGTVVTTSSRLLDAEVGDDLVGIAGYTVVVNKREKHLNGDVTLFGTVKGTNYQAIITRGKTATAARINTPEGVYNIKITSEGERLYTPKDNAQMETLPYDNGGVPVPVPEITTNKQKKNVLSNQAVVTNGKLIPNVNIYDAADTSIATIDIMMVWDAAFENEHGTADGAINTLNQYISLANQSFADSNVYIKLQLIHNYKVEFLRHAKIGDTLNSLTEGLSIFADVKATREKYKADLVGFITALKPVHTEGDKIICGVAWKLNDLLNTGGDVITEASRIDGGKAHSFFVVLDGQVQLSTKNKTYNCSDYVLAHEVGHNLGGSHDREHVVDLSEDVIGYNYGFGESNTHTEYGTIMSYSSKGIHLFSNPHIYCNKAVEEAPNIACGKVDYADNAQAFNRTRHIIAAFDGGVDTKVAIPKISADDFQVSSYSPFWLLLIIFVACFSYCWSWLRRDYKIN